MKTCTECKYEKNLNEFCKSNRSKDGFLSYCKLCRKYKRLNKKIKPEVKDGHKICYKCKEEKLFNEFHFANKQLNKLKASCKKCVNTPRIKEEPDGYKKCSKCSLVMEESKFPIMKRRGKYKISCWCKDCTKKRHKKYREENYEKYKAGVRRYNKFRRKNDIEYKIKCNVRTRMNSALKNIPKNGSTMKLVGCTAKELKIYLENQFTESMTWENHGVFGWHIDHILPCDSFDLTDPEQQKICFHYTNLQPLWSTENWAKNNRF